MIRLLCILRVRVLWGVLCVITHVRFSLVSVKRVFCHVRDLLVRGGVYLQVLFVGLA